MPAFLRRMPAGIVGSITRANSGFTVEPALIDPTNPPTAYGQFVKLNGNNIRALASGDAATVVAGVVVRPYPFQSTTNGFGAAAPPASTYGDLLKRGYFSAALAAGTAARGAQVFVRITAGSGRAVGAIETAADAGNCVAVVGAFFTGPADANGITEIAYNI